MNRFVCLLTIVGLIVLATPARAQSIWLDADAGCSGARTTDPDDCLALYALGAAGAELVGISATGGNADAASSIKLLTALTTSMRASKLSVPVPVRAEKAAEAICNAAASDNLTVLATGPLTNIASAALACPADFADIERIIFVGGKRAGHVFHPAENRMRKAAFGHGPIFRDLNVELDPKAVETVLATGVAIHLVTYEAARGVELTAGWLDELASRDAAGDWLAQRARPWLGWWQSDIGREGFYPFDLVAAAAILKPDALACQSVEARVARDSKINPFAGPMSLLIVPAESGNTTACLSLAPGGGKRILNLLTDSKEPRRHD